MKKRLLLILLCFSLILSIYITGCQSGQSSNPANNETNEEVATDNGETKDEYHIQITSGRPGDTWFVLSHALSTFINERSDWLTAKIVTTAGVADNTRIIAPDEEMRASALNVTMLPGATVWGEGEYLPLQVSMLGMLNETFVTLDPDIKELSDFSGMGVALARDVPDGYGFIFRNMIDLAGATDYKIHHGGVGDRQTALQDGAAKVGMLPFDFYYPDEFALSASLMELSGRGTLYFPNQGNVSENLDIVAEACIIDPFTGDSELPPLGMVAPAGSLGEQQTEDMVYVSTPVYWSAGIEMPEEVVYEITRIIYEAAENGDFESYHIMGKGITPDFMSKSFWTDEEQRNSMFHPGALKFYEDMGIELESFLD